LTANVERRWRQTVSTIGRQKDDPDRGDGEKEALKRPWPRLAEIREAGRQKREQRQTHSDQDVAHPLSEC
jgi:hypothetical protein